MARPHEARTGLRKRGEDGDVRVLDRTDLDLHARDSRRHRTLEVVAEADGYRIAPRQTMILLSTGRWWPFRNSHCAFRRFLMCEGFSAGPSRSESSGALR
jgi:hypothetical protein